MCQTWNGVKLTAIACAVAGLGLTWSTVGAAEDKAAAPPAASDLDKLEGQPVDLALHAYKYRADTPEENDPETAWFRSPDGQNTWVRPSAVVSNSEEWVLCGLLWEGRVPIKSVEFHWPTNSAHVPPPEACILRLFSSQFPWWGGEPDLKSNRDGVPNKARIEATVLTPDRAPDVSKDQNGTTYSYDVSSLLSKDPSSQGPLPALETCPVDQLVVYVKRDAGEPRKDGSDQPAWAAPCIRALGDAPWKRSEIEIEWGFLPQTKNLPFDGSIEAYFGLIGKVAPLKDDTGTVPTGPLAWKSAPADGPRRGIVVSLACSAMPSGLGPKGADTKRLGLRTDQTVVTVSTVSGSFSFLVDDLKTGPILAPEYGFFVSKAGDGKTARAYAEEIEKKNVKSIRQLTRESGLETTWEQTVRVLSKMKSGDPLPPYENVPEEPPMQIDLPDKRLADMWRAGAWRLKSRCEPVKNSKMMVPKHQYGHIAQEAHRFILAIHLAGMHQHADGLLRFWLDGQGKNSLNAGWFASSEGCLISPGDRHGWGTGTMLRVLAEHYALTGDKEWLKEVAPQMKAAAQCIIRERKSFMRDVPHRERLWSCGLQPPTNIGDPSSVRPWYTTDAYYYIGLKRCGEVLSEIEPDEGARLIEEAGEYRKDILRAVEKSITHAPVVRVRNGTYRTFVPVIPYSRGTASRVMGLQMCGHGGPQWIDTELTIMPLIQPAGLLALDDPRVDGWLDVMEDVMLAKNRWVPAEVKGQPAELQWFWRGGWAYQTGYNRLAEILLLGDDAPCFLRSFMNQIGPFINLDPKQNYCFTEHTYGDGAGRSEHSEGAMLERLRCMLVMEQDGSLWLARATPRVWLAQGQKISVKNAPTYFGVATYEIVSDVDNGKIDATIEMPSRPPAPDGGGRAGKPPQAVMLRFRHPKAAPIKSVTVNGREWKDFDKDKECVALKGLTGKVTVSARY
jgi:hypothetical protein